MIESNLVNPRERLVRINEGRLVAGVCTGLSIRYRLPLSLIRLGFIVLAMLTAIIGALIIYLILCLKLPLVSLDLAFPGEDGSSPDSLTQEVRNLVKEFIPLPDGPAGERLVGIIIYATIIFLLVSAVTSFLTTFYSS